MASKLKCSKCGEQIDMPKQCEQPMHAERVGGELKLVCWMGPDCGVAEIPSHCGAPMREAG
jgi:hypothetical protein